MRWTTREFHWNPLRLPYIMTTVYDDQCGNYRIVLCCLIAKKHIRSTYIEPFYGKFSDQLHSVHADALVEIAKTFATQLSVYWLLRK